MMEDSGYRQYRVMWRGLGRAGFEAKVFRPHVDAGPNLEPRWIPTGLGGEVVVSALDEEHAIDRALDYLLAVKPEVYEDWQTRIVREGSYGH